MIARDKIVAVSLGGGAGLIMVFLAVNSLVLSPLRDTAKQSEKAAADINNYQKLNAVGKSVLQDLKDLAARTLGYDEGEVAELVRARLAQLLAASGLTNERWTLTPVAASQLNGPNRDKRVGWTINARGRLDQVVNFLDLLDAEPQVHRLENLVLRPTRGEVTLDVNFMVLVLENRKDQPLPTTMPVVPPKTIDPADQTIQLIAARDLFRPYIPKKAEPPVQVVSTPTDTSPRYTPPPAAGPETRMKLIGLSSWPEPEIVISDAGTPKVYKIGDKLLDARIIDVDYRPMPYPDVKDILSEGRVILKIGEDYWALERGRVLAQKHKLSVDQLPDSLRPAPQSAPANPPPAEVSAGG